MVLLNGLIFFISQHGKIRQHLTNVLDAFVIDEWTHTQLFFFLFNFVQTN